MSHVPTSNKLRKKSSVSYIIIGNTTGFTCHEMFQYSLKLQVEGVLFVALVLLQRNIWLWMLTNYCTITTVSSVCEFK